MLLCDCRLVGEMGVETVSLRRITQLVPENFLKQKELGTNLLVVGAELKHRRLKLLLLQRQINVSLLVFTYKHGGERV